MKRYYLPIIAGLLILLSCNEKDKDKELKLLYESKGILNFKSTVQINDDIVKFYFISGEKFETRDSIVFYYSLKEEKLISKFKEYKDSLVNVYNDSDRIICIKSQEREKGIIQVTNADASRWDDVIWGKQYLILDNDILFWTIDNSSNLYLVKKTLKNGKLLWSMKYFDYLPLRLELNKLDKEKILVSDQDEFSAIITHDNGEIEQNIASIINTDSYTVRITGTSKLVLLGKSLVMYDYNERKVVWSNELLNFNYGIIPQMHNNRIVIPDNRKIVIYDSKGKNIKDIEIETSVDNLFIIYGDILFYDTSGNKFMMLNLNKVI